MIFPLQRPQKSKTSTSSKIRMARSRVVAMCRQALRGFWVGYQRNHYPDQSNPGNAKAKNFDRSSEALLA
jgi:hypothetical protein